MNASDDVRIKYFAMFPLRHLKPAVQNYLSACDQTCCSKTQPCPVPGFNCDGLHLQREILDLTTELTWCPQPPVEYRQRFLKMLIEMVEDHDWEVREEIWCHVSSTAGYTADRRDVEDSTGGFRTFFLPDGSTVAVSYEPFLISEGTTGFTTWDAAFYMVEWLSLHPQLLCNMKVMELGSGSGFTGMCITKMFLPAAYTFSDCHPEVLKKLHRNLTLNKVAEIPSVHIAMIDWDVATKELFEKWSPDIIIACDIAYDTDLIKAFFRALSLAISCSDADKRIMTYVALKVRNELTFQSFKDTAVLNGFDLSECTGEAHGNVFCHGTYDAADCVIFKLSRVAQPYSIIKFNILH